MGGSVETMQETTIKLNIVHSKLCNCARNHINSFTTKEWIKTQVTIQEFYYGGRDVRDKYIHPAGFPTNLPKHFIKSFTHGVN